MNTVQRYLRPAKKREKGVDHLFKSKLQNCIDQITYREEDWAALEQMLGKLKI